MYSTIIDKPLKYSASVAQAVNRFPVLVPHGVRTPLDRLCSSNYALFLYSSHNIFFSPSRKQQHKVGLLAEHKLLNRIIANKKN